MKKIRAKPRRAVGAGLAPRLREPVFPALPFPVKVGCSCGPGTAPGTVPTLGSSGPTSAEVGGGAPHRPWLRQERGQDLLGGSFGASQLPRWNLGTAWDAKWASLASPALLASMVAPQFHAKKKKEKKRRKINPGVVHQPHTCISGPASPLQRDEPCGGPHQPCQAPKARGGAGRGGSQVPVGGAQRQPIPLPQKWEAGPGWGYSWFPVTWGPGTAGRDRKWSAWASDHCSAGYVVFCIRLEEN